MQNIKRIKVVPLAENIILEILFIDRMLFEILIQ